MKEQKHFNFPLLTIQAKKYIQCTLVFIDDEINIVDFDLDGGANVRRARMSEAHYASVMGLC